MSKNQKLIVLFVPPEKLVNGGILSIFSIARESRKYHSIHGAEVIISTLPGTKSYKKNDLFKNDEFVYSFEEVIARGTPEFLQLHVPEYASYETFMSLKNYHNYVTAVKDLRINILNQNILLMQPPHEIALWFSLTPIVTQTTAHDKYTRQRLADAYDTPTKHLSTFVDASQYHWLPYDQKTNVIALSPDERPERPGIVDMLNKEFPNYKIITINGLSYEEYKKFISTAKFTITFGEGFDGYYVEPFLSGGVSLATYNDEFFPDKDFASYDNVLPNYEAMLQELPKLIKKLDKKPVYEAVVVKNLKKINNLYNFSAYQNNIKQFYQGKFTFVPRPQSAELLMGSLIRRHYKILCQKDLIIAERDRTIRDMAVLIEEKETAYQVSSRKMAALESSLSWKVTKPLRKASSIVKKSRPTPSTGP